MLAKKLADGTVVKTNLIPRQKVCWYDLTEAERAEFDYRDTEDKQAAFDGVRFKGSVWDLGEFMRTDTEGALNKAEWHGVSGQSAFHGVVVHLCEDSDYVVMGQVFS